MTRLPVCAAYPNCSDCRWRREAEWIRRETAQEKVTASPAPDPIRRGGAAPADVTDRTEKAA